MSEVYGKGAFDQCDRKLKMQIPYMKNPIVKIVREYPPLTEENVRCAIAHAAALVREEE